MKISTIAVSSKKPYTELAFKIDDPSHANPYRSSECAIDGLFTLPSGKVLRVPAFYDGPKGWKLRFFARESGECRVTLEVTIRGQKTEHDGPSFAINYSHDAGIVKVSKTAPRYLELENGQGFFIVGQNVCFTSDIARAIPCNKMVSPDLPWDQAYAKWFAGMGKNGANWARIWMRPNFTIEARQPWDWSLDNARRVDKLLEMARKNGLYLCLCFNAERSEKGTIMGGTFPPFTAGTTAWGPLMASQGLDFGSFAVNDLAKEMYRDKIRYIVARWGADTHVGAWEFWNEIDAVEFGGTVEWSKEMTAYLREVDPWHHIIKSSGHIPVNNRFWGKEHGDLNDVHPYFGWAGDEEPKNLGTFLTKFSENARKDPLPYIIGETGIAREVTTKHGLAGDLADKDTTGFHIYESLMGGLFSGSVGSGLPWWWDEHVELHNAYGRFKAFKAFVKDIAFNKESFELDFDSTIDSNELSLQSLKGKSAMLLWVRLKERNWFTLVVDQKAFKPVTSASLQLERLEPGTYRVEFWKVEGGKKSSNRSLKVDRTGIANIKLPKVLEDLGVKIIRE